MSNPHDSDHGSSPALRRLNMDVSPELLEFIDKLPPATPEQEAARGFLTDMLLSKESKWALMPKAADDNMIRAGAVAVDDYDGDAARAAKRIYAVMAAAAPVPPSILESGGETNPTGARVSAEAFSSTAFGDEKGELLELLDKRIERETALIEAKAHYKLDRSDLLHNVMLDRLIRKHLTGRAVAIERPSSREDVSTSPPPTDVGRGKA